MCLAFVYPPLLQLQVRWGMLWVNHAAAKPDDDDDYDPPEEWDKIDIEIEPLWGKGTRP